MGAFVDKVPIGSGYTGLPDVFNDVDNRILEVQTFANEWSNRLSDAINNLSNVPAYTDSNGINVSANIPNLAHPAFPNRPGFNYQLDTNWPTDVIPSPDTKDIDVDLTINPPTKPSPIDRDFNYTPNNYNSCLHDRICQFITSDLLNGGNGLTDAVFGMIVNRAREERRRAEERNLRKAMNAVGGRGWAFPGGQAASVIREFMVEVHTKDIDAVNSAQIKDFELADQNTRFIKELSTKVEEMFQRAFDTEEARLFEIAKASKEMILSAYEQDVKQYLAEWEGEKTRLDAKKKQIDAIIAYNEGQVKEMVGRADVLKARISAIAEKNRGVTDMAKAEADIYRSEVQAVAAEWNALSDEVKVALERYKTEVTAAVSQEDLRLKAYATQADLNTKISQGVANIAAQTVASALSAIHTSLSLGWRGSRSASTNRSLHNNLSESHSYKEE